jgi:3-oxoacyl-[acyl-carrier-protein] synthase III
VTHTLFSLPDQLAILGTGCSLPGPALTSEQLIALVERGFQQSLGRRGRALARRLNVRTRHIVRDFQLRLESPREGHSNPELAAEAVRKALKEANLDVNDLGYLIGHTATPCRCLPSNIAEVAVLLGFRGPFCEFRQACTGFINGVIFAAGLLQRPDAKPVAIVGSETGSVFFDPVRLSEDEGQAVNFLQMGDAAAAAILAPRQSGLAWLGDIYHGQRSARSAPGLLMSRGGSNFPGNPDRLVLEFEHNFDAIREHGVSLLTAGLEALHHLGHSPEEFSHFLPHQANGRLGTIMAEYLPTTSQVIVHADRVGNTGSAAIWAALDDSRRALTRDQSIWVLGAEATRSMYGGFSYHPG